MTKSNRQVSILIINYNVTGLLRECLLSLYRQIKGIDSFEILVADNASPDTSWKVLINEFPEVRFFALEENRGFSKANNFLAERATGEYLLLLNPDTLFLDENLVELLSFAEAQARFGIAGVRLVDANGRFHPEAKRGIPGAWTSFSKLFLKNKTNRGTKGYYREDIKDSQVAKVEVVTGAFLLIKKHLYDALGGLDPRYFMYGEDIDLCITALNAGYTNWYYGKMTVLHYKGESTLKDAEYLRRFYGAMAIFVDKYYKKHPIQWGALRFGLWLKYQIEQRKI